MRARLFAVTLALLLGASLSQVAHAQFGGGGPPAVGVVKVAKQPVTEQDEFVGRIQAIDRVDIVARVTAYLTERAFTEGAEVEKGALLYRLERGPFEADVQAKQAAVQQAQALLRNATIVLNRAQSLLGTPAGQRSSVDDAQAQQASQAAQVLGAQAQLRASQINLDYTEIRAPVAGKIARTALTVGNVVSPGSGALTTIVSQDPMYVLFPVSIRAALDLRNRYAPKGGLDAVRVKVRLPDGSLYGQTGTLEYIDPTIATNTDTLTFRGRMPNPLRDGAKLGQPGNRDLVDGEFVTVVLEGAAPVMALGVPRSAVLSDQGGNYVYVVGADNKVQQKHIQLGQSTAQTAVILSGVNEGDAVVVEGLQRVRPGAQVTPGPAGAAPGAARS